MRAQRCWKGKKKFPFTSFYRLQGPREPRRTAVGCGIMTKQFSVLSKPQIPVGFQKKKQNHKTPPELAACCKDGALPDTLQSP